MPSLEYAGHWAEGDHHGLDITLEWTIKSGTANDACMDAACSKEERYEDTDSFILELEK